jgi:hypothetical protein
VVEQQLFQSDLRRCVCEVKVVEDVKFGVVFDEVCGGGGGGGVAESLLLLDVVCELTERLVKEISPEWCIRTCGTIHFRLSAARGGAVCLSKPLWGRWLTANLLMFRRLSPGFSALCYSYYHLDCM